MPDLDAPRYAIPCLDAQGELTGRTLVCPDRKRIMTTLCVEGVDFCDFEGRVVETYFGSEFLHCYLTPEYDGGRLEWHSRGSVESGAAGLQVQHGDYTTEDLFRVTEDGPFDRSGTYAIRDGDIALSWWVYANWTYTWQEIVRARFFLP